MALSEENYDNESERIRKENESIKKKLKEEHGALFSKSGSNLEPEIENQFLKNVEEFEKAFAENKQILLYDFIGKPKYRKVATIPDTEIEKEFKRLINILGKNRIQIDSLCEVDTRELYRFLTEELFEHEIDDLRIPGMITHFTYEEFHPNHQYDIENHSQDFVNSFFNLDSDFYKTFLTKEAEENKWFDNFRDSFSVLETKYFEIKNIEFDTEKAKLDFEMEFKGTIEGSYEKQKYSGNGQIELQYLYEFWCIHKIQIPPCISNSK